MSTSDAREQFLIDTVDRAIVDLETVVRRACPHTKRDLVPVIEGLRAGRVEADGGVEP